MITSIKSYLIDKKYKNIDLLLFHHFVLLVIFKSSSALKIKGFI